ncbi:hypothetical protein LOAG_01384 [Loa loa]|uniref:Uncharacterized protein n=1 Tax=Loa loa TaxID=7209 RepID=A0A1S0U9K9_LOALO|nr:hypothetical protein LOAG_01384 [Loa loa]EFO27095.1 hypothetical protein LOAG_01384 [Loa loa]
MRLLSEGQFYHISRAAADSQGDSFINERQCRPTYDLLRFLSLVFSRHFCNTITTVAEAEAALIYDSGNLFQFIQYVAPVSYMCANDVNDDWTEQIEDSKSFGLFSVSTVVLFSFYKTTVKDEKMVSLSIFLFFISLAIMVSEMYDCIQN